MPRCANCGDLHFKTPLLLRLHLLKSRAPHPSCLLCCPRRRFVSDEALAKHKNMHHPYRCEKCNRVFKTTVSLIEHYRGSPFHPNCVKCGYGSIDEEANRQHHDANHPQASCSRCDGLKIYTDSWAQHLFRSPNHPTCSSCSRGFEDDIKYAEHLFNAHFKCFMCRVGFETEEELKRHFATHPECSLCGQRFRTDEELETHFATHPTCSVCEERFGTNDALAAHSVHHPRCTTCSDVFADELSFRDHFCISNQDAESVLTASSGSTPSLDEDWVCFDSMSSSEYSQDSDIMKAKVSSYSTLPCSQPGLENDTATPKDATADILEVVTLEVMMDNRAARMVDDLVGDLPADTLASPIDIHLVRMVNDLVDDEPDPRPKARSHVGLQYIVRSGTSLPMQMQPHPSRVSLPNSISYRRQANNMLSRASVLSAPLAYSCKICGRNLCKQPVVTACGQLCCRSCIMVRLGRNGRSPPYQRIGRNSL